MTAKHFFFLAGGNFKRFFFFFFKIQKYHNATVDENERERERDDTEDIPKCDPGGPNNFYLVLVMKRANGGRTP